MEKRQQLPNIELRSEEVQELMGKIPPAILRVGISVILSFVLLVFTASYFIKYPNTVTIPIVAKNVNLMTEVKATCSGQIIDLNVKSGHIHKGDTLLKIAISHEDKAGILSIESPLSGSVRPCGIFQENDYVNEGEGLFFVVDSIRKKIIAKASIPVGLKKKVTIGMSVESSINDIALKGKVTSIAEYTNPNNGTYAITLEFATPRELASSIVWNVHTDAKLIITERTIFENFFKDKIMNFQNK